MKKIFFIIFSFLSPILSAQEIQILSQKDKKAVAFANIVYLVNDSVVGGTYTNQDGKALLELVGRVNFIAVSSVGYQTLKIAKNDIPKQVDLNENVTELGTVTLTTEKIITHYLGNFIKNIRINTHIFWHFHAGSEKIMLIENPFKEGKFIKSFSFFLENLDNVSPVFKVVFYKNVNGYPAQSYLYNSKDNIFILKKNQTKKNKLDIQNMNVTLPEEGIFVGLEYVGFMDNDNKNIITTNDFFTSMEKKPTGISIVEIRQKSEKVPYVYRKLKFNEKTKDWIDYSQSNYPGLAPNEYYVPAFGIEVYE